MNVAAPLPSEEPLTEAEIAEITALIEKQKATSMRGPLNAVSAYNQWVPRLLAAYLRQAKQ